MFHCCINVKIVKKCVDKIKKNIKLILLCNDDHTEKTIELKIYSTIYNTSSDTCISYNTSIIPTVRNVKELYSTIIFIADIQQKPQEHSLFVGNYNELSDIIMVINDMLLTRHYSTFITKCNKHRISTVLVKSIIKYRKRLYNIIKV